MEKRNNAFTLAEVFSPHPQGQLRFGFTLAEVLITLGIIGVVAAITMSVLIQNYKVRQTVTQLKKINSTLQNAFNMVKMQEHGGLDMRDWENVSLETFTDELAKYLKTIKVCQVGTAAKCFTSTKYSNLNGARNALYATSKHSGMILNDGTALLIAFSSQEYLEAGGKTMYGQIFVDLNGSQKGPNTLGKDVFSFVIQYNKVIARGTYSPYSADGGGYCNKNSSAGSNSHNGLGCTAFVIYDESMDYLKCDVTWKKPYCD